MIPVLWLGIGIFISVCVCNRLFASGVIHSSALYEVFLTKYRKKAVSSEVARKILILRAAEACGVGYFLQGRRKELFLRILPFLFGAVSAGRLVFLTWSRGFMGMFVFLLLWMPHEICFLALWILFIVRAVSPYEIRPREYYAALIVLFCTGCLMEILIHPYFLHFL